jgi:preprotein translocase subunit SecG
MKFNGIPLLIVLAIIVIAVVGMFLMSRVKGGGMPSYRAQAIMTANEVEFFGRLIQALPACFVFPQVAMSALLSPALPTGHKMFRAAFGRISQKRVDFVIYDGQMTLLCVVELDDRTHNARKDAERDGMLSGAGIKTIRWHSKKKPNLEEIAKAVVGSIVPG